METKLVEFSLVVLANDHNPTIINPDFLIRTGIIKDDWGWNVVGQPITTPALTSVQYDSNTIITVDPIKLQITDTQPTINEDNRICDFISNYVRILPHVKYVALGVNFTMITMVDNVDDYLTERFLKDGSWNQDENRIQSLGFKFSYELENGNILFSIDKGLRKEITTPFIVSKANFHRNLNLDNMPTSNQIKDYLGGIMNDWKKFQQLHTTIIEE